MCAQEGLVARPSKRSRFPGSDGDPTFEASEEASTLNQVGISKLMCGQDDQAEIYFSKALKRIILDDDSGETDAALCDKHCCARRGSLSSRRTSLSSVSSQDEVTAQADSLSVQQLHQRQEYDEGLHVYSEPISLQDLPVPPLCSVSLLYNVGLTHSRRGQFSEATKWFTRALEATSSIRPSDASSDSNGVACDLLATTQVMLYHNLGYCQFRQGNNMEAMNCFQKARYYCQQTPPHSSPFHTAATNNCIAVVHFHRDDTAPDCATMLQLLQTSISVYRSHYGPHSVQVATILNNIGRVHYLSGDFENALSVYDDALRIRRQLLGANSIDVAATVCNAGQTHHRMGNYNRAMSLYAEFLGMANAQYGDEKNHRDIALIYSCMAEIHQECQELDQAKLMYERALQSGERAMGASHPEIASLLNKLGNLYYEMGHDLDDALQCYMRGLEIEKTVLPAGHQRTLITLMNIAHIHRHRADHAAALMTYTELLNLQLEAHGPDSLEVASTLSSMGEMEYLREQYSAALELYQEALRIQRDHYGLSMDTGGGNSQDTDHHLDIATTLNSIGLILIQQSAYTMAADCCNNSLRIRQSLLGESSQEVAVVWYNLGTINIMSGEDAGAIICYKEALRIKQQEMEHNREDVDMILQQLGLVYQQSGEPDHALVYFSKALVIKRDSLQSAMGDPAAFREHQIAIAKLLNLIGNIQLQLGNVADMMICYGQAVRMYRELEQQQPGDPSAPFGDDALLIAGYNFYGMSRLHPPCAPVA